MKKNLQSFIAFIAIVLPVLVNGQVTVTNSIFPSPGDTLLTIGAQDAGGFDPSLIGEDIEWDLRGITSGISNTTLYTDASEGDAADQFPDADLLDKSANQEIYYKTFNNKIVEIGRSGLDPVLNIINLSFVNEGEAVLRRAPMSFGDAYDDDYSFSVDAPGSVIPDTLFPDIAPLVDSIRLTVETENNDFIDSWGVLRLPGGDYDVLRIKRTTSTNAILEVKGGLLGWFVLDENSFLFPALGEFGELLGETITTSYQFYGNDNKEILANITYDDEGTLITAEYKGELSTSVGEINFNTAGVKTYPNPTYGDVTFELSNLPKGDYSVVLYNIIGKKLWSSSFDANATKLSTNLGQLRRGTYFYSILDESGRKIATKRIMIITP